MKIELEEQLVAKYPRLFYGKSTERDWTCFGCECGDGWHKIIDAACSQIDWYIKTFDPESSFRWSQIKQKFGGLRLYYDGHGKPGDDFVSGVVRLAESISYKTCEQCGGNGTPSGKFWIETLCEDCRRNGK